MDNDVESDPDKDEDRDIDEATIILINNLGSNFRNHLRTLQANIQKLKNVNHTNYINDFRNGNVELESIRLRMCIIRAHKAISMMRERIEKTSDAIQNLSVDSNNQSSVYNMIDHLLELLKTENLHLDSYEEFLDQIPLLVDENTMEEVIFGIAWSCNNAVEKINNQYDIISSEYDNISIILGINENNIDNDINEKDSNKINENPNENIDNSDEMNENPNTINENPNENIDNSDDSNGNSMNDSEIMRLMRIIRPYSPNNGAHDIIKDINGDVKLCDDDNFSNDELLIRRVANMEYIGDMINELKKLSNTVNMTNFPKQSVMLSHYLKIIRKCIYRMGIDTRVKTHLYGDLINLLNIIDSIGRDVDSFNRYINTHYSNRTQSAGMDAMSFDYVLREIINHHANSLINDYIKFVNSHAKNFPDIQDPYHIFTNL